MRPEQKAEPRIQSVRRPPLASRRSRLCRSPRSLDFHKCVTQLDREWTQQVAAACAVAGSARLLQRRGGGADAGCTDCLRGALELVRSRGQGRKVAGVRGSFNLVFRLHRRFTEFPKERIDGGAVVTEPNRKHFAVNRPSGFPEVRWSASTALAPDRHPA